MRKLYLLSTLVLTVLAGNFCSAQDFSNKGKDFWVAYGYHTIMNPGNSQDMVLYFAADQASNVTVSIPGLGYTQNYFVAANTVLTSNPIPKAGAQDARLTGASPVATGENKGIHITSDKPIVAYAHIYNASVSGATILYPTPTLGKEYYSINYTNNSNTANANCWFYVVAADPGTTTVEITPTAPTINNYPVGVPFTVTLTQGQVFNVMGQTTGNSGSDLTGSIIKSINTGSGCKRIGVFSGSGRINISCNGALTGNSSDNYMVQAVPRTAWGKKYLTSPTGVNMANNIFRICVSNPATVVTVNGGPIAVPLQNNFYYEIPRTDRPMTIEADIPITVAQYITSQNGTGCNNPGPGDPEVIYLSPVEQNINKVLWNATGNFSIQEHYISVIIPNTGTAISSFRLDGAPVPASSFILHQNPGYSYLTQAVGAGQHTILSDSGFNAIAYGFGNAESYGYNAGTNIKDIYQFISLANQYATVNFPATCKNTPFDLSMTFPYQPTRIEWQFSGLFTDVIINTPVPTSTSVVNGRNLYTYTLPTQYTIPTAGTYPIRVVASNPTPDGCGGIQEIDFDIQVFDPPTADFSFSNVGCANTPVQFTSTNNGNGRPVTNWFWNFGDASTATINNPSHTYTAGGSYTVKYAIRTDVGCISDTASHVVTVGNLPTASFTKTGPFCAGKVVSFTDQSTVVGSTTVVKWTWNFGDATPPVVVNAPSSPNQTHTYAAPGTYTVSLIAESSTGCVSIAFTDQVVINANPVANFSLPNVCMPSGLAQFNDLTTIAGGTISTWAWNFGDAGTAATQNPLHTYTGPGPFTVTLVTTSNNGCVDTKVQTLTSVYAEPQAAFTNAAEICLGAVASFTDQSAAPGSMVTQWNWNFGDATTSTQQNPSHTYTAAGTYTVTLSVTSAAGCATVNNTATHTIIVNPLPTISFTNSSPVCAADNILFTSTSVPNAGVFNQYNWTVNTAPTGGNTSTLNYIPAAAGTYTVQLSATTDKGCTNTNSSTVTVNAKPVVNFSLPVVCLPAGVAQFNDLSTVAGGTITGWSWNFGDAGTAATQNPSHVYATGGPFTVSLTATSNNGCASTGTQSLTTVYAEPQAAFNAPVEVCLGAPVNLTDNSTAAGSSVTQWNWNFGDATTSTVQNPSHTYAAAGTYTITLNITSAAGCQTVNNTATRTVIVNPLPVADFSTSLPGCVTRNITFNDASAANAGALIKWNWNYGDATTAILTTSNPFTHVYNTVGTYNVTLQVETNKGCVSTIVTKPIEINVLPKAGFITPEACISDIATQFIDTSRVSPGTIAAWQWNFGDANANAGNPNTSTIQNATHHFTATGNYTTTLIAYSDKGCTDTARSTFFVNGSVPVAGFTVSNPNNLCSNQVVDIKDASTVDVGSLVKVEIFWDYTNNPTIKLVDNDPVPGEVYSHAYPEFGTPATPRIITIRYVAYSGATCLSTFSRTITLLPTPTLQFSALPPVCEDAAAFQVSQAQVTNGLPGTGTFSGAGISGTGLFTPAAAGTGSHAITYTYTGINGCSNAISRMIDVNPKPGINAGPDKVVLEGGFVVLTPAVNASVPVTYLWSPSAGLNNVTIPGPQASPTDDITYTLTVTSDKGCKASDDVFVKLLKKVLIPNIFSPNGDGVHDRWDIPYLESYPGCTIDIYNRYGQLVYHSVGYATAWDGKANGKDVPVGTYYYVIDPKNGRSKLAGYVDVIR